jgi:hypothetical protein
VLKVNPNPNPNPNLLQIRRRHLGKIKHKEDGLQEASEPAN